MGKLADLFDATPGGTLGLEEEVWLLDARTYAPLPRVDALLGRVAGDERFKPELPAAQVEIVTPPATTAGEAIAALAEGRRALARAAEGIGMLAAAGVPPLGPREGELNPAPRYESIRTEYGPIARLQMVSSLQVHVAVGGAARTLAVYGALREHLPDLAALAANAAVYAGRDSGLASVRPFVSELLPRQGVPPTLASWEAYEDALRAVGEPRLWWWELRPHVVHGTLELRVPDAQATTADAAAVTAFVEALVGRLAARADAGDLPAPADTWRIEENRWSAARHGAGGTMTDPRTGRRERTSERLERLMGELGVPQAAPLLASGGAARQRAAFARSGARGVARELIDAFLA